VSDRPHAHPRLLFALRASLAAVWLHEGVVRKILQPSAEELAVVRAMPLIGGERARATLAVIGAGEALLGLAVLSGRSHRSLGLLQAGLITAMNSLGIVFGKGAIADPLDLVVKNAPLVVAALALAELGPGSLRKEAP